MRHPRIKVPGHAAGYHVVTRVYGREFRIDGQMKEYFINIFPFVFTALLSIIIILIFRVTFNYNSKYTGMLASIACVFIVTMSITCICSKGRQTIREVLEIKRDLFRM